MRKELGRDPAFLPKNSSLYTVCSLCPFGIRHDYSVDRFSKIKPICYNKQKNLNTSDFFELGFYTAFMKRNYIKIKEKRVGGDEYIGTDGIILTYFH